MTNPPHNLTPLIQGGPALLVLLVFAACVAEGTEAEPRTAPSAEMPEVVYEPMSASTARAQADRWLEEIAVADAPLREAVAPYWQFEGEPTVEDIFDAALRTFYMADPEAREIVDACLSETPTIVPQPFAALTSESRGDFYLHNMRYFYARFLTIGTAYDEALELFEQIDPTYLVDPAGGLFYKSVCQHSLLQKEAGLQTISLLLENVEQLPERYRSVAELMKADLEILEDQSLGEVAREMKDVRRRLALGYSGPRVQRVEERIISTLDELIKKLEEQQGGGGGGGGSQGGGKADPSSPMQDSYLGGQKGPGEVERKDLGEDDRWGGLPEKEKADAKNLINRQFPAHYRQAVEEYLKKLAERTAPQR
jgi:hypothetical protein